MADAAALPQAPAVLAIDGPGSVVKMLELALIKKAGKPSLGEQKLKPKATDPVQPKPVVPMVRHWPTRDDSLRFECGGDERMEYFCMGLQGQRPHMEDRCCAVLQLPGYERAGLFGVFDGHGGHQVAEVASKRLPQILGSNLQQLEPREALTTSFSMLDLELWKMCSESPGPTVRSGAHPFDRMGTTACVCLVLREEPLRVLCANVGDSRAVMSGTEFSEDHKPQNPIERHRIEAAGGDVVMCGPCFRIDSGLNLSRAFGDFWYKTKYGLAPHLQKVISVPDITERFLRDTDTFLVMGSDGVFDVQTSEALAEKLTTARSQGRTWKESIHNALKHSLPSGDNVSVCLVDFKVRAEASHSE